MSGEGEQSGCCGRVEDGLAASFLFFEEDVLKVSCVMGSSGY